MAVPMLIRGMLDDAALTLVAIIVLLWRRSLDKKKMKKRCYCRDFLEPLHVRSCHSAMGRRSNRHR